MKSCKFPTAVLLASLFAARPALSQQAGQGSAFPKIFEGLWEGADRIDVFGEDSVSVILKTFYSWYYDGSDSFHNDTTIPGKPQVRVSYGEWISADDAWAGELLVRYPGNKEEFRIPCAIVGGKLYLDFALALQDGAYLQKRGISHKVGRSPFWQDTEIVSRYIDGDSVYLIRYWETDMEYQPDVMSSFYDGGRVFYVNKFIMTAGKTFACCSGRETRIRSVTKLDSSDSGLASVSYSSDRTIACFGEPYLSKIPAEGGKTWAEQLEGIIREKNSRVHVIPGPVWPSQLKKKREEK